jgi:hypothetical protein
MMGRLSLILLILIAIQGCGSDKSTDSKDKTLDISTDWISTDTNVVGNNIFLFKNGGADLGQVRDKRFKIDGGDYVATSRSKTEKSSVRFTYECTLVNLSDSPKIFGGTWVIFYDSFGLEIEGANNAIRTDNNDYGEQVVLAPNESVSVSRQGEIVRMNTSDIWKLGNIVVQPTPGIFDVENGERSGENLASTITR